jgi:GT2 family glycosyltransferase
LSDNASADDTARVLRDEYGDFVRVVSNPANWGFAGGTNAGLAAAKEDWVALLNNDAEAEPDWLFELASAISRNPDAGMLASKIRALSDSHHPR